jgi:futalosine hydrolase
LSLRLLLTVIPDICTMYILLTAATNFEIQATIEFIKKNGLGIGEHEFDILITGAGMVPATYCLTHTIGKRRPHFIIQAGIAGCFTDKKLCETVIVKEDLLGDVGVWEDKKFKNLFDLNLAGKNDTPFTNGMLINPWKTLLSIGSLENVRGITINEISTSPEKIKWFKLNYNPVVESMEGAALHYVCLHEKIPFLQIRSISNYIGERDKKKWDITGAITNLNADLISLLTELSTKDETYFRL